MTTIAAPLHTAPSPKRALFFIVLAFVLTGLMAIPLSRHAAVSHSNSKYNARDIQERITKGQYDQIEAWHCPVPNNAHTKVLIHIKGILWAGLIVGHEKESDVIITGYAAPRPYWDAAIVRDGCAPVALP